MLAAGAVDVLQADATRCGGYTGFVQAAALCGAHHLPLSSHCAPALHVPVGCAGRPFRHAESFHDHVRIESMFFDGIASPVGGALKPDLTRPGNGLELKRSDVKHSPCEHPCVMNRLNAASPRRRPGPSPPAK